MGDETAALVASHDEQIRETVQKERGRLFSFIRKRIASDEEAEDIVQDVFYELVQTYRLMKPVEQLASWLFTVARNKITDRYRKNKTVLLEESRSFSETDSDESLFLADILPSGELTVEEQMFFDAIMEMISEALDELPPAQRSAFVKHEIDGLGLKEIAESEQVPLKTIISRKRYAVIFLRERLQKVYDDFNNNK